MEKEATKEFWDGFKEFLGNKYKLRPTTAPSSYLLDTNFKPSTITIRSNLKKNYLRCQIRFPKSNKKATEFLQYLHHNGEVAKIEKELNAYGEGEYREMREGAKQDKKINPTMTLTFQAPNICEESRWNEYYQRQLENTELFMGIFAKHYKKMKGLDDE